MAPATVAYPVPPPSTPFTHLISDQVVAQVSHLQLASGLVLESVPVAYRVWGTLNEDKSNCMVICHALTGSANVQEWWGSLLGPGRVFDPTRYFIFCANVLGSPYGTASPVSINPATGKRWGPDFPDTTARDDVALQKIVLDHLGVRRVAVVIGASMGGMTCLEWPLCTPPGYVGHVIPIATCPRYSAWAISWGEVQRQSIYSDPKYRNGHYDQADPPTMGLAAARMAALLTYRSRDSFESRFGRKRGSTKRTPKPPCPNSPPGDSLTDEDRTTLADADGQSAGCASEEGHKSQQVNGCNGSSSHNVTDEIATCTEVFSAQLYLQYQGDKFVSRFDANCYIHLTRKLDAHDVYHGREGNALAKVPPGALVIAIKTDGLFPLIEHEELVHFMPEARLVVVDSTDGHDGFLLEVDQISKHLLEHLHSRLPGLYRTQNMLRQVCC